MFNFRAGARLRWVAALLLGTLALYGCADNSKPNERVTGDCEVLVIRCSSRQSTIDLTAAQRTALALLQERTFPDLSKARSVTASAAALQALGFRVLSKNPRAGLVHAELDEVVATKVQRRRRVLVKLLAGMTGIPLQGRRLQGPDHESIQALAAVRPDASTHAMVVHLELEDTVVDSKGNSRTSTPTESKPYSDFFRAFAGAQKREPTGE